MTARNLLLSSVLVIVSVAAATAQSTDVPAPAMYKPVPAEAGEITSQKLLVDRITFAKEAYGLNEEQAKKIVPLLEQLVPAQDRYDLKMRLTLRRTALAASLATHSRVNPPSDREGTVARLEDQIRSVHANAPMSLAGIMKVVEPILPKEQVDAAHNRIKSEAATRLKRDAAAIDLAKIDALLAPPLTLIAPVPMQPPPTDIQPSSPESTSATPPQPAPVDPHAKAAPPPPPPPQPPKPIPPAPPEDQWTKDHQAIIAKYEFSDVQKMTAEAALKGCIDRAAAHREAHKADYETAQKLSDPAAKETMTKALQLPLDKLYDELVQRTEALATLEQKLRAEGKVLLPPKTPPAAVAPPTVKPPATPATTQPAAPLPAAKPPSAAPAPVPPAPPSSQPTKG
jgi:hypothetical protein